MTTQETYTGGPVPERTQEEIAEARATWQASVEKGTSTPASALDTQVGGSHYKGLKIQPAEYCYTNRIEKLEGDVIAYVTRWRNKNGVEDLKKARHTLDLLIELEARHGHL